MENNPDSHIVSGNIERFLNIHNPSDFAVSVAGLIGEQWEATGMVGFEIDSGDQFTPANGVSVHRIDIERYLDEFDASSDSRVSLVEPTSGWITLDDGTVSTVIAINLADTFVLVLAIDTIDWAEMYRINRAATILDALYRVKFIEDLAPDDRSIVEPSGLDVGAWYLDTRTGAFRYVTHERETALDFDDDLVEPAAYLERVHSADRSALELAWEEGLTTGRFESIHRVMHDDGHRWVHMIAAVESDGDGASVNALGLARDLTDTTHRWSELVRFRELVDHSSDAVYVIDRDSACILDVNRRACEHLGYERDELLGKTVIDIDPEFTWDLWVEFRNSVKEQGSSRIEVSHQRKDGSTFPVEIEVSYVSLDREYHVATVRDITERKARERELNEAEARYRTLIDNAPDGILVVDAERLVILDSNHSAETMLDRSADELAGTAFADIVPDEDHDRFLDGFESRMDSGTVFHRFDDGSRLEVHTADGDTVPVSITCNTAKLSGREVVFVSIRDITRQQAHEETLAALNTACQRIHRSTSDLEIAETVVSTAIEILDLNGVAVYRFDQETYALEPMATSTDLTTVIGEPPTLPIKDSVAGRVFTEGETEVHADIREDPEAYNQQSPFQSEILVPVGRFGIVLVGDQRPDYFDALTVDLIEILASNAETAFSRHEREQILRESELELKHQTASLERVKELNTQIRHLTRTLVRAESKAEVESAICDRLTEADAVVFAWLGVVDPIEAAIELRAWSGADAGYLDSVTHEFDGEEPDEPAVRVIKTGEPVYIPNCAREMDSVSWRQEAIRRSFKSILCVPIAHRDVIHGVLEIIADVPDAFDKEFRAVMSEVATIVAYSLSSINRKQAIISNQTTEVEFALDDTRCFFLRAAEASGCDIELNGLIPQEDGGTLGFITITDGELDELTSFLDDSSLIRHYRVLTDDDEPLVQLRFGGPFIGTHLAEYGLMLRRATAGGGTCRLAVSIPPTVELNHAVDIVETMFDNATPVSKREHGLTDTTTMEQLPNRYLGQLTDRQREAIELAYRRGYFETPKRATGAEIAEDMGISHSAFHSHLRTAERQLFEELFAEFQAMPSEPSR